MKRPVSPQPRRAGRVQRRIGFIGAGRTGSAFAWHCNRLGYSIAGVSDRVPKQAWVVYGLLKQRYRRLSATEVAAASDVLFFTTPDRAIALRFESARRWLTPGVIVVHCSGSLGVDAFTGAREQGLDTLAIHPAQSFPSHAEAIRRLPGAFFAVEGSPRGIRFGRELVAGLHGECLVVRGADRPLYHAMCVFASNFISAVLDGGETLGSKLGMSRRRAARLLAPLARGVIDVAGESGAGGALTGPVARGDAETVARHLDALGRRAPGLVASYRVLSLGLVDLAARQGLGSRAAQRLRRVLNR